MSYYKNKVRILTDLERMWLKSMNDTITEVNQQLTMIGASIQKTDVHLLDRALDRGIDVDDLCLVINYTFKNRLCEMLYDLERDQNEFIKFIIQYSNEFFIHCTFKKYENGHRVIRVHTLIPYRDNYVQERFTLKVGKLIRKVEKNS